MKKPKKELNKKVKDIQILVFLISLILFVLIDEIYFSYFYFYKKIDITASFYNIIPLSIALTISLILIIIITKLLSNTLLKIMEEKIKEKEDQILFVKKSMKDPIFKIKENALILKSANEKNKWVQNILNETTSLNLMLDQKEEGNVAKNLLDEKTSKENFDLSKIINDIASSYDAICFKNNIEYIKNIQSNLTYFGNEKDLTLLSKILLENAIKNVSFNGLIQVSLFKDNNGVFLSFYNSGCKIKEENKKEVYKAFYSKPNHNNKNFATNSYFELMKTIIEKNNYTLYLDSKEDVFFKISLKL